MNKKNNCDFCGSNTGPSDLQSDALPTELKPLIMQILFGKVVILYGLDTCGTSLFHNPLAHQSDV